MTWLLVSMSAFLGVAVAAVFFALHNSGDRKTNDPNWLEDKYGELLEVTLASRDRGVIVQGPRGEVIRANDAACRILGLTHPQLLGPPGRHPTWTMDPEEGPPWPVESEAVSVSFYSGAPQTRVTTGIRRGDGQVRWLAITTNPLRAKNGTVGYVMATFDDITETMDASENTVWHTLHDDLTGLENKIRLTDRMEHAIARQARHGGQMALLLCDLDQLRAINDSHGRAHGDKVLIEVAERLRDVARDSDTVVRYRDDEFAVFIEDGGVEAALVLAGRLQAAVGQPMTFAGAGDELVSMTIGIAPACGSVDAMLAAATSAVIRAKADGRNRVLVFETSDVQTPAPQGADGRGTPRPRGHRNAPRRTTTTTG